ncbi:MAG: nucleotidyltransferase family protein [Chloroherpetonaceae bacterium]|nr:nucleotidyltransferase family protein [Chloroherpetonaceae bacterium]MCS7211175.1 nucleotidyltransferase family protein [Chloroherpetonaceae bacterium]MDW8020326.1 nucleotidyltransferase family protein [Chloroherpetonaceae bacterium]
MLSKVSIIILAAGASRRLGQPKQLLRFLGKSLIQRAATEALAVSPKEVLCVLGAFAEQIKPELAGMPVRIVENREWPEGIASSIRAGIAALQLTDADAAILMLCDQPFIDRAVLRELMTMWQSSTEPIVATSYGDTVGVPALFSRSLFPELLRLRGDTGARPLIFRYPHRRIPCPQSPADIDTPDDKRALDALNSPDSH